MVVVTMEVDTCSYKSGSLILSDSKMKQIEELKFYYLIVWKI